nr:DNA methyltransferase [Desulfoscipio gibsoniae]
MFVKDVLDRITIQKGATVLDPWNGSGTTTLVAAERGYKAIGFDINLVMFIVAKAKALDRGVANSIPSLARNIYKLRLT